MAKQIHPMRPDGIAHKSITEDTPLTPEEQKFIAEYMRTSSGTEALKAAGICVGGRQDYSARARDILKRPNVRAEIRKIMDEIKGEAVATASEVMTYFTSVMRGEIKDQFGLEAPLSERTRAAQELAKRTIDIDNREAGKPDQTIAIKLDWNRDNNKQEEA